MKLFKINLFSILFSTFLIFLNSSIICGKTILVLGGGGARGIAHIGVIEKLEEFGIKVDGVVGTSIGAIIGAAYAYGIDTQSMLSLAREFANSGGIQSLIEMNGMIERGGLVPTERIEKLLRNIFGYVKIEDLKLEFKCVAYDVKNSRKIIFDKGDLVKAILASSAYPGMIEPVRYENSILLDGGLVDNLPIDVARSMGADFIIVSDISSGLIWQIPLDYLDKLKDFKNFMMKLMESIRISHIKELDEVHESVLKVLEFSENNVIPYYDRANIVVKPFMDVEAGVWDFDMYRSFYFLGKVAVEREKDAFITQR